MSETTRLPIGLVPAYKPDDRLVLSLIELIKENVFHEIYCIDDGSGEAYGEIFLSFEKLGVKVLRHCENLGKGMALKTALNVIAVNHPSAPGVVTFDADGQHRVTDICKTANSLHKNPESLILGSRKLPANAPLRSRFGNKLTRIILRFFTGINLQDTQTGLRAIPLNLIPKLLKIKTNGYDFELDMLIKAHENGMSFVEIPIESVYINNNEGSHFDPVFDSLKIYFVFIRYSTVSIITAIIDYVVFAAVFLLYKNLLTSIIAGRIFGSSFQFVTTKKFVFNKNEKFVLYLIKYISALMLLSSITYGLMYLAHEKNILTPLITKVIVEGVVFLISFLLLREWVFSSKEP